MIASAVKVPRTRQKTVGFSCWLLVTPDLNNWFIKFCNDWAGVAQFVGLFIGAIGFFWTIVTAKRAEKAAQEARDKVLKVGTVVNFSFVLAAMEEMMRMHLNGNWQISLTRASELRRFLVDIKSNGKKFTGEQATEIQGVIEQFRTIEATLERIVSKEKLPPAPDKINTIVRKQIEKIQVIANNFKNE